ncbi:hypothetical protein ASA1KI_45500 [Opitutales bacterium ASA1]|uniref:hypothetical protein n=1 Tax=Congregicoccus parvus TaxID=3081749 RepID=UPI002B301876|nr:hypothetical protein ASA1KI_45500 [Opitutales bacterium ASA1]
MLTSFPLSLIAAFITLGAIGYLATSYHAIQQAGTCRAFSNAPLLGLSLLVLVAENATRCHLPLSTIAPWYILALFALGILTIIRSPHVPILVLKHRSRVALHCALAALPIAAYSIHFASIDPESFSGHSNPDSFNQTAVAEYLRNHSIKEPVNIESENGWLTPIARYQNADVRLGASLFVALLAEANAKDSQQVFFLGHFVALLLVYCAVFTGLRHTFGLPRATSLAGALMAASHGTLAHLVFNAGLPFLLSLPLYFSSICRLHDLAQERNPTVRHFLESAVVLAGAVSIYPEFLPIFTSIAAAYSLTFAGTALLAFLKKALVWALLVLALNPMRSLTLVSYLLHQAKQSPGTAYERHFMFDWPLLALGIVPLDTRNSLPYLFLGDLGAYALGAFASAFLLALGVLAIHQRARIPSLLWIALFILGSWICWFSVTRSNEYAALRLLTSASTILAAIAAIAMFESRMPRMAVRSLLAAVVVLQLSAGATFSIALSSYLDRPFIYERDAKRLANFQSTMRELGRIVSDIPEIAVVGIDSRHVPTQAWFAYHLRAVRTHVTPMNPYIHDTPPPERSITHLLTTSQKAIKNSPFSEDSTQPAWESRGIALVPTPSVRVEPQSGVYPVEGDEMHPFTWLKRESTFAIRGDLSGMSADVTLHPRVKGTLRVSLDDINLQEFALTAAKLDLRIPLPDRANAAAPGILRFYFTEPPTPIPNDNRELCARLTSLRINVPGP